MQTILLGPAGLGGKEEAPKNLEYFHQNKITACEIAFTYSVYLNNKASKEIGELAKELKIKLSIHAPYYINLNSTEKQKIAASKKRILDCCERANYLDASHVVFHPGYFGKIDQKQTYETIKAEIQDMQDTIKSNNWKTKLAPETTGKTSVFGSLDEIIQLVKETKCSFCIDFAHLKARNLGKIDYPEIFKKLKQFKNIHCHFSGINFGPKGERNHIPTETKLIKELAENILKSKINTTIINEAPNPVADTIKTIKVFEELGYSF